jgi:predicted RNA-binding Zn-ribbon protein involved in translation (DUF1610 family)
MTEIGQAAMLTVAGKRFHCGECGVTVFTRQEDWNGDQIYTCNGCGLEYASAS